MNKELKYIHGSVKHTSNKQDLLNSERPLPNSTNQSKQNSFNLGKDSYLHNKKNSMNSSVISGGLGDVSIYEVGMTESTNNNQKRGLKSIRDTDTNI